ncbi:uncharacterized protein NECHADRAFT_48936 [Fusarium vanettenii 77-13-4]|uniref:Glycosyltransferase family 2 n=1 Tax=Fusarium vanettenii (strain ATCC MYA-4622 / CBS 123669 / FGSC 9596 / NRRL 45880 / 77-13-4) TaxID=660122 RepID=C7YVE6_FUSV7|nr:uncharacterized protein NECHADRAFT_48936 [Fusarium vanettenii 77-13-4]EEU44965.1 hypothetical protein NECHADRAFT_48936 [Fusarium vanettenii 77-13-4]
MAPTPPPPPPPAKKRGFFSRCFPSTLLLVLLAPSLTCIWLFINDLWTKIFFTLFTLRYARLVGHILGSWIYRPAEIVPDPAFKREDVSVILPTVDPQGPDFRECVLSIMANRPEAIYVVTVGAQLREQCKAVVERLSNEANYKGAYLAALPIASKRRQVAHAVPRIKTAVTVLADDHVFWPETFLPSVLAPLNDGSVGMVATKKRVRRTTPGNWGWTDFVNFIVNFIACNYLQRHNWELRASSGIDGGLFVISGRTAVYRTEFLRDGNLMDKLCSEKFFFGLLGGTGLGPDDDNFLTRAAMKKGWRVFFQDTEEATIETTLGLCPKFSDQLLRWARTTFRSNPVMLRDPKFVVTYAWSAFMVYWAALVNFAILWDAALIFSLISIKNVQPYQIALGAVWIAWTKVIKILPHFYRHPADILLVIVQILFAYIHSFYKLWALLTFWDCGWSGRNLADVNGNQGDTLDTSFVYL